MSKHQNAKTSEKFDLGLQSEKVFVFFVQVSALFQCVGQSGSNAVVAWVSGALASLSELRFAALYGKKQKTQADRR